MIPTLQVEVIDIALVSAYPLFFAFLKDDTLSVLLLVDFIVVLRFRYGSTLEGIPFLLCGMAWRGM